MTTEFKKDPRTTFVPRYLPWILAGVMLVVYWITLERSASLLNVDYVAWLSGWRWQPQIHHPLNFLVTLPLHGLPVTQIPLALNMLAAVFGVLTLALLARSVALLPHDRTEAQRVREISDFSFLTTGLAWLPPLFAVLVCGLQFTFWENATNFTGKTVDLFVFAFTIWSLLEYRLDEREIRLAVAMVLYGADMSQNVGLFGYLPLLLAALIWIRGMGFFNSGFLTRMALCGLAGLSLYFLLPTLGVISGMVPGNLWWTPVKLNLAEQWHVIKLFFTYTEFRHDLGLISLTTLLPVIMMAFRWGASFGDRSRLGSELTSLLIHLVYGVFMAICLWSAFDPPFSARHLGAGFPFLSFLGMDYLAALSVGYFSGYFLLISKPIVLKASRRRPSAFKKISHPAAVVIIVMLATLTTAGLVSKNGDTIQSINSNQIDHYARQLAACLPQTGGIVFSDNEGGAEDIPYRLFLVQEALAQAGREKDFIPVDTLAMSDPNFHRYLHKKYPGKWPLMVDEKSHKTLDPHGLLNFVSVLAKTNDLYYLHPSFGYYFERFYLEPHGLIYKLKPLPDDTLLPRLPDSRLKAENEAFWTQLEAQEFAPIAKAVAPVNPFDRPRGLKQKIMARLHVLPEANLNATMAGRYYSRNLDFWGVEEQRGNDLAAAAAHFATAQRLDPDNLVAGINLEFNKSFQAGKIPPVDLSKTSSDQMGKFHSAQEMVTENGPFDEPSFCFLNGQECVAVGYFNQAIAAYSRVHQLIPDDLPTRLSLAGLYVFTFRADLALAMLKEPLANPGKFSLNDTNSMELNQIAAAAYIQKQDLVHGTSLLEKEIARHPDNAELLASATKIFLSQNLFTNALHVINLKLKLTPDDPNWLYSLGWTQLRLNRYDLAIATLTRVLSLQPDNENALFNRAVAYLETDRLNAARSDYQQLQKNYPTAFLVAYGLGEIAWRQHETNDAIQNYTVYLANAPTNTAESKMIRERLDSLQGKAP